MVDLCDKKELTQLEQYYIDSLKSYNHNIGYNICELATSSLGVKRREETKIKIRLSKLRNPTRYWSGKKLSKEHKAKIGLRSLGRGLNTHLGAIEFLKATNGYSKKDRFRARIRHNKKRYNLGCYDSREDALKDGRGFHRRL